MLGQQQTGKNNYHSPLGIAKREGERGGGEEGEREREKEREGGERERKGGGGKESFHYKKRERKRERYNCEKLVGPFNSFVYRGCLYTRLEHRT